MKIDETWTISDMAGMVETRLIEAINLMDAILIEIEPQNDDAEQTVDDIATLCEIMEKAYNRAKSALNELEEE